MITIQEFIEKHNITIECVKVHENPNMIDKEWKADHFLCTLIKKETHKGNEYKKTMQLFFSQGVGYRKGFKIPNPKLDSVLDCLVSDADCLEYVFSEWCDSLGFDNDSIKARNCYNTSIDQSIKLKNFLGSDAFEELKNCERL